METAIRKYSTTLKISAWANIAFGAWTVVKTYMTFLIPTTQLDEIRESAAEVDLSLTYIMNLVGILLFIALLIRIHIARRAFKEVRGEKAGSFYIVLSVLFIAGHMASLIADIVTSASGEHIDFMILVSDVTIELTSIYASFDLVRSAILLRRARKILADGKEA